jgi:hypothetical protein
VIVFDGTIDHQYTVTRDAEFLTIHLPRDIHFVDTLLRSPVSAASPKEE